MKITKRQLRRIIKEEQGRLSGEPAQHLHDIKEGMIDVIYQSLEAIASYDPDGLTALKIEIQRRGLDLTKEALEALSNQGA